MDLFIDAVDIYYTRISGLSSSPVRKPSCPCPLCSRTLPNTSTHSCFLGNTFCNCPDHYQLTNLVKEIYKILGVENDAFYSASPMILSSKDHNKVCGFNDINLIDNLKVIYQVSFVVEGVGMGVIRHYHSAKAGAQSYKMSLEVIHREKKKSFFFFIEDDLSVFGMHDDLFKYQMTVVERNGFCRSSGREKRQIIHGNNKGVICHW